MDSAYYTASLTNVLKNLPKYKKVKLPFLELPKRSQSVMGDKQQLMKDKR